MPISRSQLGTRLSVLKKQLEQLKQQYIALTGAIADTEYWLEVEAKEQEAVDPTDKSEG